jgi:hypothetical protein
VTIQNNNNTGKATAFNKTRLFILENAEIKITKNGNMNVLATIRNLAPEGMRLKILANPDNRRE